MDIADRRGLAVRAPRTAVVGVLALGSTALLAVGVLVRPSDAAPVPLWVLIAMLACGIGVAVLSTRFDDAARWRTGLTLGVLLMVYAPIFATASTAPRTLPAILVSTAATWWQCPVILASQVLLLHSVERATARSTRRVRLVVVILTGVSLALVLVPGPASDTGIPWFIPPGSSFDVVLRALAVASLPLWLATVVVTPLIAWWRAARMPRADRGAAVIAAVAAVSPLVLIVMCGALVVVTTLDGVPHAIAYPILGLGLPVAMLISVLLVRGPDDPRSRRGALVAFGATAVLVSVVVSVVVAVLAAPAGATMSALIALGAFIVLAAASVPAHLWMRRTLVSAAAQMPSATAVADVAAPSPADIGRLESLTPREREVLGLLALGLSNAGIARRLTTSPRTIDAHVRSIFVKLGTTQDPDENQRVRAAMRWMSAADEARLAVESTDNLPI